MIYRGSCRNLTYSCASLLLGLLINFSLLADDGLEFFEKQIRPVLVEHCYNCHSSEAEKLKGGLLLDTKEGLLKGGDTGPALAPGKPGESLLIKALEYKDENLQMPPKQKLSDKHIADFRKWIEQGAPDPRTGGGAISQTGIDYESARKQWAFSKPVDPPLPAIKKQGWAKNGVDHFILAGLEHAGLQPAQAADKRTLIRRVTFDLTGIPPTPKEVADFLADTSGEAYERLIDRLLASPLYGERWARHWLDVVRYTDSFDARGVGGDADVPEAYRYRDWVVNAFNKDLPYDQFILKQFAGDILQPKSPEEIDVDSLVATSVFVIGEWGIGDADKEKMLTDIVDDQIDVTGRAFLGLTLACARCHDHKFDPISNEDYYGLAGIFFSSHILPNPGLKTAGSPVLRIPLASKAELERRKAREERIKLLERETEDLKSAALLPLINNSLPETASYLNAVAEYKFALDQGELMDRHDFAKHRSLEPLVFQRWLDLLGLGELPLMQQFARDIHGKPGLHAWRGAADTPSVTINTTASELSFITIKMPASSVAMHPSPSAAVAVAWKAPKDGTYTMSARMADADPNCGNGIDWTVNVRANGILRQLANGSLNNGASGQAVPSDHPALKSIQLKQGDLLALSIGPRGDYSCDTTVIQVEVEASGSDAKWDLSRNVIASLKSGQSSNPSGPWHFYDLGRNSSAEKFAEGSKLRDWLTALGEKNQSLVEKSARELRESLNQFEKERADGKSLDEIAKQPAGKLFKALLSPGSELWAPLRDREEFRTRKQNLRLTSMLAELNDLRRNVPPPLPVAHGMQEGGVPDSVHAGIKDARIHIRGRYDRLGDVVPRGFPRVLAGEDQPLITEGSGRLQLARWIASPEHPLTARVMVNRIWQHHFGEGLVRTPNNFGKLGEPPTHPELLDWLAHRFIESGWSIKAMHRLLLLSATYQQSSLPHENALEVDPGNKLWGRMNRRRMEAEVLRDSILAVNGTLDFTTGGKAVRDLNSRRRTLYQMTIRSIRNDYRALFDAADSTSIVEKRTVSTVAPQALFLLNHPFVLAEVKQLARRVLATASRTDEARVKWLYETLFSREPSSREIELARLALEKIYSSAEGDFAERELSAWEAYCQLLIASNEFVFID